MSTAQTIRTDIRKLPRGRPFTTSRFVREDEIERLSRGVFVRPRKSRFVGTVLPAVAEVVRVIAKDNGEAVQVHGAEAARRPFSIPVRPPARSGSATPRSG